MSDEYTTVGSDYIRSVDDYDNLFNTLIVEQFKDTQVEDLLKTLSSESEELETAILDVLRKYWIDTAEGVQLDILADYVDVDRDGKTDDELARLIKAKISINTSTGTREAIITAVKEFFNASQVILTYLYPAKIAIQEDGDDVDFTDEFKAIIETVAPAGVGLRYFQSLVTNLSREQLVTTGGVELVTAEI
jgi:hypothetical protein